MSKRFATTVMDRRMATIRLMGLFNEWIGMANADLLTEARRDFPAISEATRDECLKMLTLSFVEKHFR